MTLPSSTAVQQRTTDIQIKSGLLDEQILGDYLRSNKEYLDYLETT